MYDYIIVGGGPAGATAAYCLQRRGFRCVLLEAQSPKEEKTCGGYLTRKGIELLHTIGIEPERLLRCGAQKIDMWQLYQDGKEYLHRYHSGEFGIGIKRLMLDQWLLDCAEEAGAAIRLGCAVKDFQAVPGGYSTQEVTGKHIVFATGARGFVKTVNRSTLDNQTLGISAQIRCSGGSKLQSNRVYFWFLRNGSNDYFWAIPIGHALWNIGIWLQKADLGAREAFEENRRRWIDPALEHWNYIRTPRAAFCGNVDLSKQLPPGCYGIGDFAGCNVEETGEGLRYAIASALSFAERVEGTE